MGFFKGLSGSASPDGGGGKLFGKLLGQNPDRQQGNFDPAAYKSADEIAAFKAANPGVQMKKGGKVSSASARADGCCVKGKTKGRMV